MRVPVANAVRQSPARAADPSSRLRHPAQVKHPDKTPLVHHGQVPHAGREHRLRRLLDRDFRTYGDRRTVQHILHARFPDAPTVGHGVSHVSVKMPIGMRVATSSSTTSTEDPACRIRYAAAARWASGSTVVITGGMTSAAVTVWFRAGVSILAAFRFVNAPASAIRLVGLPMLAPVVASAAN